MQWADSTGTTLHTWLTDLNTATSKVVVEMVEDPGVEGASTQVPLLR